MQVVVGSNLQLIDIPACFLGTIPDLKISQAKCTISERKQQGNIVIFKNKRKLASNGYNVT